MYLFCRGSKTLVLQESVVQLFERNAEMLEENLTFNRNLVLVGVSSR